MTYQTLRFKHHATGRTEIRIARTEGGYPWAYKTIARTTDGQCFGITDKGYVYRVDYPDHYYLGDQGTLQ